MLKALNSLRNINNKQQDKKEERLDKGKSNYNIETYLLGIL